jgi:hypothetical protein
MENNPDREPLILLPEGSAVAQSALRTGWLLDSSLETPAPRRVIARGVVTVGGGASVSVAFEPVSAVGRKSRWFGAWMRAIRAFSLTATLTPCLAVYLLARGRSWPVDLACALTAALGVALLQISVNVLNDVEDYRRLIDLPNTTGGSGVIQSGEWAPRELRAFAWGALGLGSVLGLVSVLRRPELLGFVAAIGGAGVLGMGFMFWTAH